jgi:perosamine synthetase
MLVTNRSDWESRARYLSTQAKDDALEYVHGSIGYNYRLTNIQAALGCAQMEQLHQHIAAKRRHADAYDAVLNDIAGLSGPSEAPWAASTFWLYTIRVDTDTYGCSSRQLLRRLDQHQIQSRPLWQPLHRSPAHRGAFALECCVAERLHAEALSLPCSVGLTPEQQDRVIRCLRL